MPKKKGRFWHVRVRRPVKGSRTRALALGEGILATRQKVRGAWRTQKLMFPKARFSRAEARAWVRAHKDDPIIAGSPRKRRRRRSRGFFAFLDV